jgi:hypothetical protein
MTAAKASEKMRYSSLEGWRAGDFPIRFLGADRKYMKGL